MKTKLITSILLTLVLGANLFAQTFSVNSKDGRNQASFISDAPFEKIVGLSSGLDAMVMINKDDIAAKPMGKVKVSIANIKTGIDLRDEHLRSENWLNAEKYPYAEFKLMGIKDASAGSLEDGARTNVTLVGQFSVHGVTKDIEAPATLTYFKESARTKAKAPGNLLVADTEFSIKLSDYGVQIPSMVVGKVNEEVKVTASFVASDAHHGEMNPCGPCGPNKEMKGKANPCSMKKHGKMMNNPCNPCGMKKDMKNEMKKAANPCNPCAPKK